MVISVDLWPRSCCSTSRRKPALSISVANVWRKLWRLYPLRERSARCKSFSLPSRPLHSWGCLCCGCKKGTPFFSPRKNNIFLSGRIISVTLTCRSSPILIPVRSNSRINARSRTLVVNSSSFLYLQQGWLLAALPVPWYGVFYTESCRAAVPFVPENW